MVNIVFKKIAELPEYVSSRTYEYCDSLGYLDLPALRGSQACCVDGSEADTLDVYFSARDQYKRSMPIRYTLNNRLEIIETSEVPIELGDIGTFDCDGFMISQITRSFRKQVEGSYVGWNTGNSQVRYRTACGSFIESNKYGPDLDRLPEAPCGTSMPFEFRGTAFIMAYMYWKDKEPNYVIKYRTISEDHYAHLDLTLEGEDPKDWCFARPTLIEINSKTYLFYSKRRMFDYRNNPANSYRIWVAEIEMHETVEFSITSNRPLEILNNGETLMDCYFYPVRWNNKVYGFYNTSFTGPISVAELV